MSERRPGPENLRKILHIGVGFLALALRFVPATTALLITGALVVHNLFLLPRYGRILWRQKEAERGFAVGVVLYPAVLFVLVLFFRERLHLAAAVWAILAFGDGAATLVGRNLGGPRLPWNDDKTWAGSAAHLVCGALAASAVLSFVSQGGAGGVGLSFGAALLPASAAALVATIGESSPLELDDNLTGPALAAATFWVWFAVRPDVLLSQGHILLARLPWALGSTVLLAVAAQRFRAVDLGGAIAGTVLAVVTWVFAGVGAFCLLCAFVGLGTLTTRLGYAKKEARGIAEPQAGRRGAAHALANMGVGAGLAFLAASTVHPGPFLLALAGAFAAATGDTVASELGPLFSRRPRLLTSLRAVPAGTPGAVSLAGTGAGVVGAAGIAVLGAAVGLYHLSLVWVVVVAGVLALSLESLAAALLERREVSAHHVLNFCNTICGAAACWMLAPRVGG